MRSRIRHRAARPIRAGHNTAAPREIAKPFPEESLDNPTLNFRGFRAAHLIRDGNFSVF